MSTFLTESLRITISIRQSDAYHTAFQFKEIKKPFTLNLNRFQTKHYLIASRQKRCNKRIFPEVKIIELRNTFWLALCRFTFFSQFGRFCLIRMKQIFAYGYFFFFENQEKCMFTYCCLRQVYRFNALSNRL